MANFNLQGPPRFPEGTSVGAYPVSNWPNNDPKTDAAPLGGATESKTVTSGVAAFTGLTSGVTYMAYAQVASQHVYVRFIAGEDLSATVDKATAAVAGAYRVAVPWRNAEVIDTQGAGTYGLLEGIGSLAVITADNAPFAMIYLDPADYAVAGLTTKYRVLAAYLTNTVAPTVNYTVGLYPITACAGGADAITMTVGTVVTGSTVAFTAQAASTRTTGNSGDFNTPAAGWYAMGIAVSGTPAANMDGIIGATVQARNV